MPVSANEKLVLICENTGHSASLVSQENKNYILEGIFCEFDIENNNGRIYRKKEYLPHLTYLNEKISKKCLVGELDHPDRFVTKLSEASHIIEKIWLDEKNNVIRGQIRVLNTEQGKHVQALIDDGVQLSISSRAAGVVTEDKSVRIEHLFTYDLVGDPGFENASMNMVGESKDSHKIQCINESLEGLPKNSNIYVYDMSHLQTGDVVVDGIKIYESREDSGHESEMKNINRVSMSTSNSEPTTNGDGATFVSEQTLHDYSERVSKAQSALNTRVDAIEEKLGSGDITEAMAMIKGLREDFDACLDHSNGIVEHVNLATKHSTYLAEGLNAQVEKITNMLSYAEYRDQYLDENITQTALLKEWTNEIMAVVQNHIKYSEALAETTFQSIKYTEHLTKSTEKLYQKHVALKEEHERLKSYASDYLMENMSKMVAYSEMIGQDVNTLSESLNIDGATVRISKTQPLTPADLTVPRITEITESKLNEKIEKFFEDIKKDSGVQNERDQEYPFLSLLSEDRRRTFLALDEPRKQAVVEAIATERPDSEGAVVAVMENVMTEFVNESTRWLNEMPVHYYAAWNALTERERADIALRAQKYPMTNRISVAHFWDNQRALIRKYHALNELNTAETTQLNENVVAQQPNRDVLENAELYRDAFRDAVVAQLARMNG